MVNFKNVVSFGDSFFEGSELTTSLPDNKYVAPALISNYLGLPFYNFASSGVGILSIIDQITTAEKKSILTPESFVIYSLPPSGRIDFFQTDNSKFTLDYWYFSGVLNGTFDGPVHKFIDKNESFIKYKKLHDGIGQSTDFIKMGDIIHFSGICGLMEKLRPYKSIGVIGHPQHIMTDGYSNTFYDILKNNDILFLNEGFTGWSKSKDFPIMEYGHPGIEAHEELSKLIIKKFYL